MNQRQSIRMSMMNSRIPFGGITDYEGAKAIARKLFDIYDTDRDGVLNLGEIPTMMIDAYRAMNKGFTPTKADTDSYHHLCDRDGDGRVTLRDMEELAVRFLVGDGASTKKVEIVKRKVYSADVERRLDVARRLFRAIDADSSGYITEHEVPNLLVETYKTMGMSYIPSIDDVKSWMKMTDTNNDGRVTLDEYEDLVIRSLIKAGIRVE